MKKHLLILCLTLILPTCFAGISFEENYGHYPIEIIMFHKNGCPACSQMHDFLEKLNSTYPGGLNIQEYEYSEKGVKELATNISSKYNMKLTKVPTVFINNKYFIGASNETLEQIKIQIQNCSQTQCTSPLEKQNNTNPQTKTNWFLDMLIKKGIYVLILIALVYIIMNPIKIKKSKK